MKLINLSKNNIISEEAEVAGSLLKRLKGLLGRDGLADGQCLVIRPCNSVHTFFMRFPIDVVFSDRKGRVVGLCPQLKPWQLSAIFYRAYFAVELPVGSIARNGIVLGDVLALQ